MRNLFAAFALALCAGCTLPAPTDAEVDAVQVTLDPAAHRECRFILNIEAWSDRSLSASGETEINEALYLLKREAHRAGANLVVREEPVKDGTRWHVKGKAYSCAPAKEAPSAR